MEIIKKIAKSAQITIRFLDEESKNPFHISDDFLYDGKNFNGKIKVKIEVWLEEEEFGFYSTLTYANNVNF